MFIHHTKFGWDPTWIANSSAKCINKCHISTLKTSQPEPLWSLNRFTKQGLVNNLFIFIIPNLVEIQSENDLSITCKCTSNYVASTSFITWLISSKLRGKYVHYAEDFWNIVKDYVEIRLGWTTACIYVRHVFPHYRI